MSFSTTRWRVPTGLIGMLVLVGLVETGIEAHPLRFASSASLSWRLSFERATDPTTPGPTIVCLGDSLVKIGVLPRVIEAATGGRVENYAMGHAPAPATYFLLRRMLKAGQCPRTILVDFKPSMLAGGPKFNLREWQEVLRPAEAVELASHAGGIPFLVEITLGHILPSWRSRFEIREAVASALRGEVAPTYRNNQLALRNWTINKGTHLNGPNARFDGVIAPDSRAKLIIPKWRVHDANKVYVDRFFQLAAAHKIAVVWLIAPSSPELQTLRASRGGDAAYAASIAAIRDRYPTVRVVDGRFAGYPTSTFADATHLNGRGAATLSHDLAQILTQSDSGAASRWVDLPTYRDWPLDVLAEDIERSTAILNADWLRR